MGVLVFLIAITIAVAIHETGHLLAFRLFKVPVTEFSIGMGPKVFTYLAKSGTRYTLRGFPLGGYCMPEEERALVASPFAKAVIALAGPLFNVLPILLMALVLQGPDSVMELFGILGEGYVSTLKAVWHLLTLTPMDGLSGPVGIAKESGQMAVERGFIESVLVMTVVLNLGIAMFNLLPIPVLDGGRIVMAGVEAIIGRVRTAMIEKYVLPASVVLILAIFAISLVRDILK